MVKIKNVCSALLLGGSLLLTVTACAEDPAPNRPPAPPAQGPGAPGIRGGRRGPGFNPMFETARLVMKELRAYQAKPNDETFAALEKALAEAMKIDTANRKAQLERELADLEANQAKRQSEFLSQVKSGEFKMPAPPNRPPRGNGQRPAPTNK